MMKKILGLACLVLIAHSQIVTIVPLVDGQATNSMLSAVHKEMSQISYDPKSPPRIKQGSMLKRLSNPHFSSRPFIVTGPNAPINPSDSASQQPPSSNAPRPRPIRSNGPKLCSCGHHYVDETARPVGKTASPVKQPVQSSLPATTAATCQEQSESSQEPSSGHESRQCKNCGGKDCKCSVHNPSPSNSQPKPLAKLDGKACDNCKGGKCGCSDCKCGNFRDEENQGPVIKSAKSNLIRE